MRIQQLPKLAVNTGKIAGHVVSDVVHSPQAFKNEAMIFASLILVLSRIGVSFHSVTNAPTPSQKTYRHREAIRTFIREAGGWTASFMVLRWVTSLSEKLFERFSGAQFSTLPPRGLQKAKAALSKQGNAFLKSLPLPTPSPTPVTALEATKQLSFNPQSPLGQWVKHLKPQADVLPILTKLHRVVPITVGSLASVLLSGFALEWFTINKSEQTVQELTHHIQRPAVPKGYNPFGIFLSDVTLEQARRNDWIGFGRQNNPETTG
jgi:hypothetical protein